MFSLLRFMAVPVFCILFISALFGQNSVTELERLLNDRLNRNLKDSTTARYAMLLASEYMITSSPKFFSYITLSMQIGSELPKSDILGKSYSIAGNMYKRMGMYNLALKAYYSAINEFRKNGVSKDIIYSMSDVGNIYYEKKMYDLAAKHYRLGLELDDGKRANIHPISVCYINLGLVSLKKQDYDSAKYYFGRALDIRLLLKNDFYIAHSYYYFGRTYQEKKQYDSAIFYLNKSLSYLNRNNEQTEVIAEFLEFQFDIASVMLDIYKTMGREAEVDNMYKKLLHDKVFIGLKSIAQRVYASYAEYLESKGKYKDAIIFIDESLEANESLGFLSVRMNLLLKKAALFEKVGNTTQSLRYYKEYAILSDSVNSYTVSSELLNMADKQELEQQDAKMREVISDKEKEIEVTTITRDVLIVFFLLAVAFLFAYYRKYKLDNSFLKFLRTLINSLKYPFYVINAATRKVEYYNDTAQTQFSSLKKLTNEGGDLTFTGNLDLILKELNQGKAFLQRHYEINNRGGTKNYFEVSNFPVYDNLGKIVQIIEYIRDITPLKEAELRMQEYNRELEESNLAKDRLISIIGHDLKSPFGVLLGSISILRESNDELTEEDRRRFIDNLHDAATKVYKLVENLLEWSILNAGRVAYKPERIELHYLISQCLLPFTLEAEIRNINLHVHCPDNLQVFADLNMLNTILRNLIANAIKFSQDNSAVLVKAEVCEGKALVSVTDQGIGLNQSDIEKLFRIDISNSEIGKNHKNKGTGLGLIITQEFARLNGSEISVTSNPESGTIFSFKLPLVHYSDSVISN